MHLCNFTTEQAALARLCFISQEHKLLFIFISKNFLLYSVLLERVPCVQFNTYNFQEYYQSIFVGIKIYCLTLVLFAVPYIWKCYNFMPKLAVILSEHIQLVILILCKFLQFCAFKSTTRGFFYYRISHTFKYRNKHLAID